jgi:hypothetical protein
MAETDVFDEVRGQASPPSDAAPADDVFNEVRKSAAPPAAKADPEVPSTWWNAIKGVGKAGLALGSGALRGVSSAANDLLPNWGGTREELATKIAGDPILNYSGGPEAQPILKALQKITAPVSAVGSAIHQGISDVTSPRTADVVSDVATLLPAARGWRGELGAAGAVEEGHPLTAAAQAESSRIGGFTARGQKLGMDLPEGGTAERHAEAAVTNRPIVNSTIRNELQLPANAPLSPQMLDSARTQYSAPAYQAVRDIQKIPLNKAYESAIGNIDNYDSIPLKYRPPTSGSMTGSEAVDFSRYLRNKANKYFAAAKGNPQYEDIGQAHWDAAQAVEDAVKDHLESTGKGQMASDWDKARVYAAKTYSVENALDGAGNVKVTDLKRQLLKGKPLSGDLETLANLGAQYPEAFRTTRVTMPQAGPIRRATAAAAPVVGAGVGGWLGGPLGGAAGTAVGQNVGERILR